MPVYFFWGEDEYRLTQAVKTLQDQVVDPMWREFNEEVIGGDTEEGITQALITALTPPFGTGERLVWVRDTILGQRCSDSLLSELERTFPKVPDQSHLLLTSTKKPDGRLKSTKLLKKYATVKEFELISPWKTDQLLAQVESVAKEKGVKLTASGVERLAAAVGNDTRLLHLELEKLSLFVSNTDQVIDEHSIEQLVSSNTHNSLQLAKAIRDGNTHEALQLLNDLLNRNEPALKIIAVLVGQFRTWFWVRLMVEKGERDNQVIAKAAEINNPKRVYFLRQEVEQIPLPQFLNGFPILLSLEADLKQGKDVTITLQTRIIELCQIYQKQ